MSETGDPLHHGQKTSAKQWSCHGAWQHGVQTGYHLQCNGPTWSSGEDDATACEWYEHVAQDHFPTEGTAMNVCR